MKEARLSMLELALIAGTRGALGLGLGLLLADRLTDRRRQALGVALVTIGAVSTVPLAIDVLGKLRDPAAFRQSKPPVEVALARGGG